MQVQIKKVKDDEFNVSFRWLTHTENKGVGKTFPTLSAAVDWCKQNDHVIWSIDL